MDLGSGGGERGGYRPSMLTGCTSYGIEIGKMLSAVGKGAVGADEEEV